MKIGDFARENGVSARTLRYYDEIGLLRPDRTDPQTGYRDYGAAAAARLADIRFYQTAGFPLEEIPHLLALPEEARLAALARQREQLVCQRDRLDRLIRLLTPQEAPPVPQARFTSLLSAFARAFHARSAAPVFADTLARSLLTDDEWAQISGHILAGRQFLLPDMPDLPDDQALERLVNAQFLPATAARSRFSDDSLRTAMRTGAEQIVLLGAGLDTLSLRAPGLPVFEVDRPAAQADKLARIHRAGLQSGATFMPADFALDDLPARLREAGFEPARKSYFSWLGVSYYLSLPVIAELLSSVAELSARGTTLLFDYADEGFMTSPVRRVQNMIAMAQAAGEPVQTTLSQGQLAALLERHGFQVYELLPWQALQERYFAGRGDGLSAFEHIGCVLAVFTG